MDTNINQLDELSRRAFLAKTAKTCFGVTIGSSMAAMFMDSAHAENKEVIAKGGGKAKNVIYLYMSGGMTHIDTFDPKENSGVMGTTKAINGKANGIQLGHNMKKLAACSDKISIIRSMSSTQGAHGPGRYFMRTGYAPRSSITHPAVGGWVNNKKENTNPTMPGFVTINCGNGHPGAGFFEPKYNPLPIGNAIDGLKNSKRAPRVTENDFHKQLDLRHQLDAEFDARFNQGYKNVRAYDEMFNAAVKLMKSKDLEAFDLSKEDRAMHKLYGDTNFAKGCLLARRLVERNVNFIEVEMGGFDWHTDNHVTAESRLPEVDQAVAALITDLDQRGLLDSTLIVLATEFGRTPKINQNAGRDHFPKAFSCMMAGGGIKGGYVHGETDKEAANVTSKKTSAGDFNATIAHAVGLQYNEIVYSPSKRPFKMGGKDGKPLLDLFS